MLIGAKLLAEDNSGSKVRKVVCIHVWFYSREFTLASALAFAASTLVLSSLFPCKHEQRNIFCYTQISPTIVVILSILVCCVGVHAWMHYFALFVI